MKIIKATLTNENGEHQACVATLVNGEQHVTSGKGDTPHSAVYDALTNLAARLVDKAFANVSIKTVAVINT